MQLFLNELSTKKQALSIYEAEQWGIIFFENCKILKNDFKVEKIYIPENVYYDELFENFPLYRLFKSGNKEISIRVKSLKDKFISEIEIPNEFVSSSYLFNKEIAYGLGLSHFFDSFSLSFISENIWKDATIKLDNKEKVRNISLIEHFIVHKDILEKKLSEQLIIPVNHDFEDNILPFADKSSRKFNVELQLERIKKLSRGEKNAEYTKLGTKIAKFNHWEVDEFVSKINSNNKVIRTIFKIGEGSKTYYLKFRTS